jgi:selenocysteine lyase/cysteine desulfurase
LSPETIKALFNARSQAKEVIVGPNTTTDLELEGRRLER